MTIVLNDEDVSVKVKTNHSSSDENGETSTVDTLTTNIDSTKETYSCLRCRTFKKKCSRDKPKCAQCTKLSAECFYPGRAKRRRKNEIERVRNEQQQQQQEELESNNSFTNDTQIEKEDTVVKKKEKKRKATVLVKDTFNKNTSTVLPSITSLANISNISNLLNVSSTVPFSPYSSSKDLVSTPSNTASPGNFTSLCGEYLGMISNTKEPLSTTTTTNSSNNNGGAGSGSGNKSNTFSDRNVFNIASSMIGGSPVQVQSPNQIPKIYIPSNKNQFDYTTNTTGNIPLLSDGTNRLQVAQSSDINGRGSVKKDEPPQYYKHVQGALEYDLHRPISIPIKASNIQIENVTTVFQGARSTNWPVVEVAGGQEGVTGNGNGEMPAKFKEIDHNLYLLFIDAYFQHNHRSYPMINKFTFFAKIAEIKDFSKLDLDCTYDPVFLFILYMIMAIGCTSLSRAGVLKENEKELSEHFAYLGMKRFCAIMHLQNMDTIKCLILLGIYSFFEPKGISSWTIGGIISRITIGLGLNRELTESKKVGVDKLELEFRHRVFWSAYVFERLVHTSLGRASFLDDDDINVPLPAPICETEYKDIQVTEMIISIRKLGGKIYNKVHSVKAANLNIGKTIEQKQLIIDELGKELDETFDRLKHKMRKLQTMEDPPDCSPMTMSTSPDCADKNSATTPKTDISFHNSELWLVMRYEQLQITLYRPSKLLPTLPTSTLTILGQVCLTALKHTHMLFQKNMLPYNWITLFRTLTICNTLLFCLCQWCIDTKDCQIEIKQCAEILQHFGGKWLFAINCAQVFENISGSISEFSLGTSTNDKMKQLNQELFGASNEYQDILDENNVDISWLDDLLVK